jgi:PKD repeat protein
VTVEAYIIADFRLRIAGEKWHDVRLNLYSGNESIRFASITRYPGSPDDQSVTLYDVKVNLLDSFTAVIEYTPPDDPINGQIWGDNPCWLILEFENGKDVRLFHNFNVRHNETWIWVIDDFSKVLKNAPIIYEAFIPYTINYENIGTGDATDVVITDTLPVGSVILDYHPLYDMCVDNVCTWNIGDVASGETGTILINISYVFDVDGGVVNEVTLDYSDANGNFIEQLYTNATTVLIKPELWSSPKGYVGGESGPVFTSDDNLPPEAIISSPEDGSYHYVEDVIHFDGSSSTDEGRIVTYLWSFGDGEVSTAVSPSHAFVSPGIYVVTLSVTDDQGEISVAYALLIVRDRSLSAVIEQPTKEIITEGTTLAFSGKAVYEGYNDVFHCSWDFGDGTGSEEGCSTTHYYGNQGTYTITLTVFDMLGHSSSESREITVLNVKPKVKVAKNMNGLEGSAIYFTATAADQGSDDLVLTWDLGDGTFVVGNGFYHTYTDDGKYLVTLTVDDGGGGVVVKLITATVENLNPDISVDSTKLGHVNEPVYLSAGVSDAGILDTFSYSWDMGDGTVIEGTLQPVHIYSESGIYTVTLTVTDDEGGQDVSVMKVYVIETLDSTVNRPTSWKDTTTPMVITEDKIVVDNAIPLAALALVILNIVALAAGSYVRFVSKKE